MARWAEALDAQLDTYKFYSGGLGHSMASGFAKSVVRESPHNGEKGSLFYRLDDRLEVALFNADPVYVDPDMMTIFEGAWPGFKPEALAPTDLVTTSGFLLLPRPVAIRDLHDKVTSFRAALWEPVEMRAAGKDGIIEDVEPRGGIILYLFHATSDTDDYSLKGDTRLAPFILTHVMPWTFGESVFGVDDTEDERSVVRPIQCLWRLMMQTLAVHTATSAPRDFAKRWAKAKMPEKKVTVVRLRRTYEDKDHDSEPGTVAWTHRWLVGGHWRNQWYASIQQHRQIWISPYAKGPEDLPLVINKARVFEFVR